MTESPQYLVVVPTTPFIFDEYYDHLAKNYLDGIFRCYIDAGAYLHTMLKDPLSDFSESISGYLEQVLPPEIQDDTDVLLDIFVASEGLLELFEAYVMRRAPMQHEYYCYKSVRALPDHSLILMTVPL